MASGAELGVAYVTITASTKGMVGDIKSAFGSVGGMAEASGASAGGKFSRGFGGAMKGVGAVALGGLKVAAEAGAAAIGGLVSATAALGTQAVQSFAEYEQLAGGVEKIFDEMDTSQIMADAQNAYKELNMSANDYLTTINQTGAAFASTMGDETGYAIAREGMLAIADYASGTGRNLNELNEKYTLITRSTSSYQSIADQFSGILPATSAAFLEQAQAAGYLGEEYEQLTDVPIEEYQQAVTHMLTEGVEALGLAGNTAAEAASTISGSFATAQAAWANFITALGGGSDLDAAVQGLIESVQNVIANLTPVIETFITNLTAAIPEILPPLLDLLVEVIGQLAEMLPTIIPPLVDAFVAALGKINEALPQILPALIEGFVQLIVGVAEFLPSMIGTLASAAVQLFMAIVQALPEIVGALLGGLGDLIVDAASAVAGGAGQLLSAGLEMLGGMFDGVTEGFGKVGDFFGSIMDKVGSFFAGAGSWLFDAGASILQGLWDGLLSIWNGICDFVGGIGDWIVSHKGPPAYDARLLIENGALIMQGLEGGLERGFSSVQEFVHDATRELANGFSDPVALGVTGRASVAGIAGAAVGAAAGVLITGNTFNVRNDRDIDLVAERLNTYINRSDAGRVGAWA